MKRSLTRFPFATVWSLSTALMLLTSTAWGQTYVVTTTSDSGPGSLRQAISNANGSGDGTITFSSVSGTITLTSGELVISNTISILGPGSAVLAIDANSSSRVFNTCSNAMASISGVTIQGGQAITSIATNPPLPGGGIYNAGTLTLNDCIVKSNSTFTHSYLVLNYHALSGGNGGAIYNEGTMLVNRCIISSNFCQEALPSDSFGGNCQGGSGGGIYNLGTLTMSGCTMSGNSSGGSPGGSNGYQTGSGGHGGFLYNGGFTTLNNCTIYSNSCGNGGADDSAPGGAGGSGGGIYNAGTLTMNVSSVCSNSAGRGGNGGIGNVYNLYTPGGNGGSGGGILNTGVLTVANSAFYGNSTGGGGNGGFYTPQCCDIGGNGGNGGNGGGIAGGGILTNCTIVGNFTSQGGAGGSGPYGGTGGNGGSGGGIYGAGTLINCTISSNSTAQGGAGGTGITNGVAGSPGNGGGIAGSAQLLNTIVANDQSAGSGPDVSGSITSLGHNLIGNTSGSSGFGASIDLLNMNPQLGPLASNGGPTPTCALLAGSPAIDAGDDAVLNPPYNLTTDQRGFPRLSGSHVDIGAFEFMFVCPGDDLCDGIPDSWRAQYFPNQPINNANGAMTNNLSCATCDADGTGQNNLFKYVAGLDPTNPASVFTLDIQDVLDQPTQKDLTFGPIANGRTYTLESRTNLVTGAWSTQSISDIQFDGTQVTVTDASATQTKKFYRVQISYP